MGYPLVFCSTLFFAMSNLYFMKGLRMRGLHEDKLVGVLISILINNLINLVVLGIFFIFHSFPKINTLSIFYFVMGGVFNSYVGRYLLFSCFENIGASRAGSLKISAPLFTVLIGILFLREQLSLQSFAGIGSILIGIYFLSQEPHSTSIMDRCQEESKDKKHLKGIISGILSGLFIGLGNIFRKLGVIYYPEPIVGVSIGSFAALMVVSVVLIVKNKTALLRSHVDRGLNAGFIMGGVSTNLALYSLFYALRYIPVSLANSIQASEPLFVILLSLLFFKEEENINRKVIISACAVILGSVLIVTA